MVAEGPIPSLAPWEVQWSLKEHELLAKWSRVQILTLLFTSCVFLSSKQGWVPTHQNGDTGCPPL